MKYCTYCGKEMKGEENFCSNCGRNVAGNTGYVSPEQEEQEVLDWFYRLIKWERLAWRIQWIYMKIFTIVYCLILSIPLIIVSDLESGETEFPATVMMLIFVSIVLMNTLPLVIVNHVMFKKREALMYTVYDDVEQAYNTYNSPGCIVISVIFGVVSPVFTIINFARVKAKKEVFQRIISKQKATKQAENIYEA